MKWHWRCRVVSVVGLLVAPLPAIAATLVVSNATDISNGNTSTPEALAANPGTDGISLVEAIAAARGSPGPHTVTFAPSMLGQTIAPSFTYLLNHPDVAIVGLTHPDGRPGITIDSSRITGGIVVDITASHVTVSRLRFVGIRVQVISVTAGGRSFRPAPQLVEHVQIFENEFDASAFPDSRGPGIYLNIQGEATGARISGVTITRNRLARFTGDASGVLIAVGGTACVIEDIVIEGNRLDDVTFGVELVPGRGSGSRIERVRITNNAFNQHVFGVAINQIGEQDLPATGNVINGTIVRDNTFDNARVAAIFLLGGLRRAVGNIISNTSITRNVISSGAQGVQLGFIGSESLAPTDNLIHGTRIDANVLRNNAGPAIFLNSGSINAIRNAITDTLITSNLIYGTRDHAIFITTSFAGSRQGRVEEISIVNNTIAQNSGGGVRVSEDGDRLGGQNRIRGVTVVNSIVLPGSPSQALRLFEGMADAQIRYSLVGQSPVSGINGNSSADPRFINPAQGDFRLQAGSPAIDAATGDGAPRTDLDGNRRIDDPGTVNRGAGPVPYVDIGAYEFGSSPPAQPSITIVGSGPLTERVVSGTMNVPSGLRDQSGAMFVLATLPASLGGSLYSLTATGHWVRFSCESSPPTFSGRFNPGQDVSFASQAADLTALAGAAVYVGYGIGATDAAACIDMLDYSTLTSSYTIQ